VTEADRKKWDSRYRECASVDDPLPSALLENWIGLIPAGRALDIACGRGRNSLFLASHGFAVDAIDISAEALDQARYSATQRGLSVHWIEHDLDEPRDWPESYALILVVRYVNLPLVEELANRLAPGGFLLLEMHLDTEAEVAGPSSPAYRVRPGELEAVTDGLKIHHQEEAITRDRDGKTIALARVVAQRVAE
jgi:SAM-dependent methyltransferase